MHRGSFGIFAICITVAFGGNATTLEPTTIGLSISEAPASTPFPPSNATAVLLVDGDVATEEEETKGPSSEEKFALRKHNALLRRRAKVLAKQRSGDMSGMSGVIKRVRLPCRRLTANGTVPSTCGSRIVLRVDGRRFAFPYAPSRRCAFSVSDSRANLLSFDGCQGPLRGTAILGNFLYSLAQASSRNVSLPLAAGAQLPVILRAVNVRKPGPDKMHPTRHHEEDAIPHEKAVAMVARLAARRRHKREADYRSPFSYTNELLTGSLCDAVPGGSSIRTKVRVYIDRDEFYRMRKERGSLESAKSALTDRIREHLSIASNLYSARRTNLDYDIVLEMAGVKPSRIFPSSARYRGVEEVDARDYMEHFCATYRHHLARPSTDHILLYTGKRPNDASFEGLAMDFGVMCSRRTSCSMIFATAQQPAVTITHELGHAMGMYHDAERTDYGNGCPPSVHSHYIMSPWTTNQIRWSECSTQEMRQNLGCFPCMRK